MPLDTAPVCAGKPHPSRPPRAPDLPPSADKPLAYEITTASNVAADYAEKAAFHADANTQAKPMLGALRSYLRVLVPAREQSRKQRDAFSEEGARLLRLVSDLEAERDAPPPAPPMRRKQALLIGGVALTAGIGAFALYTFRRPIGRSPDPLRSDFADTTRGNFQNPLASAGGLADIESPANQPYQALPIVSAPDPHHSDRHDAALEMLNARWRSAVEGSDTSGNGGTDEGAPTVSPLPSERRGMDARKFGGESVVIYSFKDSGKDSTPAERARMAAVAIKVQAVVTEVEILLPRAARTALWKHVGGPLLRMLADQSARQPFDVERVLDVHANVVFLANATVAFSPLTNLQPGFETELTIPRNTLLNDSGPFMLADGQNWQLHASDGRFFAQHGDQRREVEYAHGPDAWRFKATEEASALSSTLLPDSSTSDGSVSTEFSRESSGGADTSSIAPHTTAG